MQEYEMKVLYEHSDKFIIKCNNELGHLCKNKFTINIKEKDNIRICADKKTVMIRDKETTVYESIEFPILNEKSKILDKSPKLTEDNLSDKTKKYISFSEEYKDYSRFLIAEKDIEKYQEGSFINRNNSILKIINVGKRFPFRNRSRKKVNTTFKDGDLVCYVYYTKSLPNWTAEEFMEAMHDYKVLVSQILKNGVKPRHKPELIQKLKGLPTLCDGRNKFLGHSWIAIDEDDIWYFTYLLSSVEFENNIKIGGKFAQCWRVSKRLIEDSLKSINTIDNLLYKTNAFPNMSEEKKLISLD